MNDCNLKIEFENIGDKMLIFKEKTQFSRPMKVILLISFFVCLTLYFVVDKAFHIGVVISFVFFIVCIVTKLDVSIYEDRIEYRLSPVHFSNKVIMFYDIKGIDFVTPESIGVLGFKIKKNLSGTVYYFGGHNILRIRTKRGKIIMLGTQRIIEMKKTLQL